MKTLCLQFSNRADRAYPLPPGHHTIGRDPANEIQLEDPLVSGRHCELIASESSIRVRDLGSTNGTFVRGDRVQEHELRVGEALAVGNTQMVLSEMAPAPMERPVGSSRRPDREGFEVKTWLWRVACILGLLIYLALALPSFRGFGTDAPATGHALFRLILAAVPGWFLIRASLNAIPSARLTQTALFAGFALLPWLSTPKSLGHHGGLEAIIGAVGLLLAILAAIQCRREGVEPTPSVFVAGLFTFGTLALGLLIRVTGSTPSGKSAGAWMHRTADYSITLPDDGWLHFQTTARSEVFRHKKPPAQLVISVVPGERTAYEKLSAQLRKLTQTPVAGSPEPHEEVGQLPDGTEFTAFEYVSHAPEKGTRFFNSVGVYWLPGKSKAIGVELQAPLLMLSAAFGEPELKRSQTIARQIRSSFQILKD